MEKRYVIINADDFGMCHSQNLATMELFRLGAITSSTIMAPAPWCGEAVAFARENPQFAIGVHLTTTSEWGFYRWGPLTGAESLMDAEKSFPHGSTEFEQKADLADVLPELRAQTEKLIALGLKPSHFDNHMGSLYGICTGRFELLQAAITFAGEYKLPFRLPKQMNQRHFDNDMLGIAVDPAKVQQLLDPMTAYAQSIGVAQPDELLPGDWNGPQNDSYENYREYIFELYRSFTPGLVTETYIHPALETDELKSICGSWQHRVWEYTLFRDPKTHAFFDSIGIEKISYRDLAASAKRWTST